MKVKVAIQPTFSRDILLGDSIIRALEKARENTKQPSVIIADTIKGKGISFMEDDNNWHYRIPNEEELSMALLELGGKDQ